MHAAKTRKLRIFHARHQPEHARLLALGQLGLAAHKVAGFTVGLFCPQLQNGPRPAPCARVHKPNGFEGAKGQCAGAALGKGLHGHAAFKMLFLLKLVGRDLLRFQQGRIKNIVFVAAHGAVEIVPLAVGLAVFLPIAGGAEHHVHIKGVRPYNGRDGVIKIAVLCTHGFCQRGGKPLGGHGPGSQHHSPALARKGREHRVVQRCHLVFHKRDIGLRRHAFGHGTGKSFAVNGQSLASGHAVGIGQFHKITAKGAHFSLEQAHAGCEFI